MTQTLDAEMTSGSANDSGDSTALAASTRSSADHDLQATSPGAVRERDETGGDDHRLKRQAVATPRGVVREHEDVSLGDPRVEAANAAVDSSDSPSASAGVTHENVSMETVLEIQSVYETLGVELSSVDIIERFNPNRFRPQASAMGLVSGTTFDLRTGWNLSCPRARNACWERLLKEDPSLVIGSPKRGPFSSLTHLIPDKTERMKAM